MAFSDKDKSDAADREVKMRKRVYPRWVADGRMTQATAEKQIAIMAEIAADYRSKTELPL